MCYDGIINYLNGCMYIILIVTEHRQINQMEHLLYLIDYHCITTISSLKCPHITGCCLLLDKRITPLLTLSYSSLAVILLSRLPSAAPLRHLTRQVVKNPFCMPLRSIEVSLCLEDRKSMTSESDCDIRLLSEGGSLSFPEKHASAKIIFRLELQFEKIALTSSYRRKSSYAQNPP